MRDLWRPGVLGAVALLSAAACSGGGAPTGGGTGGDGGLDCSGEFAKPAELRLGFQQIPNGDIVVKQSGWLEQDLAGVKVSWLPFNSGGEVNQAITANGVDIGLAGSSPVSRGVANGIPYVVPWIFDVIGKAEALAVRPEANIKSAADLVGKKVGVPFISTTHYSLLSYLKQNNVDPASVEIINMTPPDAVAAYVTGNIDAAYIWEPALGELYAAGATTLVDSAAMADAGYPTFDLTVAAKAFTDQYPCVMVAWAKAQDRAVRMIRDDVDGAAELIGREFNLDVTEAKRQMSGLGYLDASEQASDTWLGGGLAKALQQTAQYLLDQKEIEAVPDEATWNASVVKTYAEAAAG